MTTPMATEWDSLGNLTGPQGPPGADGADGAPGADGGTTPHASRHATGGSDPLTPAAIGAQPADTDLTAFAALAPADGGVLRRVSGAWSSSTIATIKTDLALAKADVGLGNVSNLAPADLGISTATQSALNLKAPLASPAFTGTPTGITKTHVGLGSVDNTADSAKPVSGAQQTALDAKRDHNQAARTLSSSGSINVDGAAAGDVDLTCTGTVTIVPTGTPNGRALAVVCLASGAQRAVSVTSTVALTTGLTTRTLTIPSGGKGVFVLRYSSLGTAGWHLASAYLVS